MGDPREAELLREGAFAKIREEKRGVVTRDDAPLPGSTATRGALNPRLDALVAHDGHIPKAADQARAARTA